MAWIRNAPSGGAEARVCAKRGGGACAHTESAPGAASIDRPGRACDARVSSPVYATAPSAVTRSGIAHAAWSECSSSSARSESGSPRKPS